MDAVMSRPRGLLGQRNAQDLANTAWAFPKVEVRNEVWMEALGNRLRRVTREIGVKSLGGVLWALTKGRLLGDVVRLLGELRHQGDNPDGIALWVPYANVCEWSL